jgi:hypothetical protein
MHFREFFVQAVVDEGDVPKTGDRGSPNIHVRYEWIFDEDYRNNTAVVSLIYEHHAEDKQRPHWFVYQLTPYWENEAEPDEAKAMRVTVESTLWFDLAFLWIGNHIPESTIRLLSNSERRSDLEKTQSTQTSTRSQTLGRRLTSGECTSVLLVKTRNKE